MKPPSPHAVPHPRAAAPNPLKLRTNAYLMAQARKMVGQAYAPAFKALDSQQSQLKAISDKRQADNAAYQQWLMGKQAQYNAQAAQAQQQYMGYLDNLRSTVEQQHQAAQQGATAAVQGQSGTVSDMSQSTALKGLSADTAKETGLVNNARQQSAALLPSLEMRQDARQQAVIGQGQAADAKRLNDFNAGLQQLNDQRMKTLASKATDIFKAYTAGQQQQVDIANANRSYNTAVGALGVKKQTLALNQTKAANAQGNANRTYNLNVKRLNQQKDLANKRIKNAAKGKQGLSAKDQSKVYQGLQTVAGLLSDLHSSHPNGLVGDGKGHLQNFRENLRAQGYSDPQIDIAIDLYAHNGKLSPYGARQAKALGIANPYKLFGKADNSIAYKSPQQPTQANVPAPGA